MGLATSTMEALQVTAALTVVIAVPFTSVTIGAFVFARSQGRLVVRSSRIGFGSTAVGLPFVGVVDSRVFTGRPVDNLSGLWVMPIVGETHVWLSIDSDFKGAAVGIESKQNLSVRVFACCELERF